MPCNHFSKRLKGKAEIKRTIPMTSVKLTATRFYQVFCVHVPTGMNLTRFGHPDGNKC
jgi:hypothetical protein